jgi:alkylation response protein AidB-like acyl-CoA dehydrogenase
METETGVRGEPRSASELLAAARELAPRIAAAAAQIEREQRLPADLNAALINAGIYKMLVPRSLGGSELPLADFCHVMEQIAAADASTAWCIGQNAGVSVLAALLPRRGAMEIFGPPDCVVAGGHGPAQAVRVGGGYRLTGRWNFGSGMHQATWLRATCDLVDESGRPLLEHRARGSLILFIPRAEVEVHEVWQVSGLRGTGSDSYSVQDLFVPEERAVLNESQEPGPLYTFGTNNVFAAGFASVALGIARATLDAFLELAVNKLPRGMTGVLREQPVVQSQVAQAEAALRSARAFLHQTIDQAWQVAEERGRMGLEERSLLRLATTYAIQSAAEVTDTAYYLAGATAIFASNPFERRFRDMHAVTQQMQSRQDHFETAGKYFLGLQAESEWL